MRLCKLVFEQYYINQYGHKELSGHTHRVLEIVNVWENEETVMFDNGYEPPYACPVWESNDGRTWAQVQNHIDYWGGEWFMKLFKEDPILSGTGNVGQMTRWETFEKAAKEQLVNEALLPVDIEGNVL